MLESCAAALRCTVKRGTHPPTLYQVTRKFYYYFTSKRERLASAGTCLHLRDYALWIDCFFFFFPCIVFLSSFCLQLEQEEVQCSKNKKEISFSSCFKCEPVSGFIHCFENTARTTKHRLVFLVSRITSVDIVFFLFSGHLAFVLFVCLFFWGGGCFCFVFLFVSGYVFIIVCHHCTAHCSGA